MNMYPAGGTEFTDLKASSLWTPPPIVGIAAGNSKQEAAKVQWSAAASTMGILLAYNDSWV